MSKLWIVHRRPPVRAALARATGVSAARVRSGGPELAGSVADSLVGSLVDSPPDSLARTLADFPAALPAPEAIVLGCDAEDDWAAERAFVDAARTRAPRAQWIVCCPARQAAKVRHRLPGLAAVVLELPLDRATLRAAIADAFARAAALPETSPAGASPRDPIGERRAARFEAWFGPGRPASGALAFDPALGQLPLLVRGRTGSGRALFLDVAERARRDSSADTAREARAHLRSPARFGLDRTLAVDGRDPNALVALVEALREAFERDPAARPTVRIRELDGLGAGDQARLAEWIASEAIDARWLATAGPAGLEDRLEESLARAFVPLTVTLPPLAAESETIERMAAYAAREWAERTGGAVKRFSPAALHALAEQPWWGERAELDAALRETLAHSTGDEIGAADLRFPDAAGDSNDDAVAASRPAASRASDLAARVFGETPELDPNADPSSALGALTDRWRPASSPSSDAPPANPSPPAVDTKRATDSPPAWRRLARSLAHEIRNPLVSIRTFTELLPDHWSDETFRTRFKELVGKDVRHIQDVVTQLARAAERERLARAPVDVSALIDRLLAERRERIVRRRLVVLCELERDRPNALADADALSAALAGLVDRALDALPDRGDLFLTTRHVARDAEGRPCLRVLLRHHNPQASGLSGELDPVNHILEYVLAETLITAQGGRMTLDPTLGPETLVVIDLPTA